MSVNSLTEDLLQHRPLRDGSHPTGDLTPTQSTLERIARAETLGRELPIAIAEGGIILERRIDRWLREAEGDLVVDYKSGQPADKDAEQVKQYCRALERMTGRTCRGLLWYIDVDRDEAVELGE